MRTVILAFSISLNVFFLLGYLHAQSTVRQMQSASGRIQLTADALKLNEQQRKQFGATADEMHKVLRDVQKAHAADLDNFWSTAQKADLDLQALREAAGPVHAMNQESLDAGLVYIQRMMQALTPEQRTELARIIRNKEK